MFNWKVLSSTLSEDSSYVKSQLQKKFHGDLECLQMCPTTINAGYFTATRTMHHYKSRYKYLTRNIETICGLNKFERTIKNISFLKQVKNPWSLLFAFVQIVKVFCLQETFL